MLKNIRFSKLKDSELGNFLIELKDFSKAYTFNILRYGSIPKGCQSWHHANIYRQVYNFYRKGYFDISKENNKTFFKLTSKGLDLVDMLRFASGKIKWDKLWRILIFDIPEKQKSKRELLRRKLKELGFRQLQQSVWIIPYPLPESFSKFLTELHVRPYLYSLTVKNINREKELKDFFGI